MGTHPIFESDFDCLTEWRRIESQFFLLEAECMMEVKFTKHLLLWSLFLVTMLRSLALLQISHSSTRSITALELLMKRLETFSKKARIARGKVTDLAELKVEEFDALLVPGGFGAAKNLSDWALKGPDCTVDATVAAKITAFHSAKKPLAFCCIAPHLAAKLIPGCTVTVGSADAQGGKWPYAEVAGAIEKLGCKHVEKTVSETCIDEENKIVTSPAFMYEGAFHEIHDGVSKMVEDLLKLC